MTHVHRINKLRVVFYIILWVFNPSAVVLLGGLTIIALLRR